MADRISVAEDMPDPVKLPVLINGQPGTLAIDRSSPELNVETKAGNVRISHRVTVRLTSGQIWVEGHGEFHTLQSGGSMSNKELKDIVIGWAKHRRTLTAPPHTSQNLGKDSVAEQLDPASTESNTRRPGERDAGTVMGNEGPGQPRRVHEPHLTSAVPPFPELAARSVSLRATWLQVGLAAGAAVEALYTLAVWSLDPSDVGSVEWALQLANWLIVARLVTLVLFIIWAYRAHSHLVYFGYTDTTFSDTATIWWWFVPLAQFFMPFRVVFEVVRGSVGPVGDPTWKSRDLPRAALAWATGLLIGTVGRRFFWQVVVDEAGRITPTSTLEDLFGVDLIIGSISVAGFVAGIILVNTVTKAQIAHLAAIGSRNRADTPRTSGSSVQHHDERGGFCTSCGAATEAEDRFCRRCGAGPLRGQTV